MSIFHSIAIYLNEKTHLVLTKVDPINHHTDELLCIVHPESRKKQKTNENIDHSQWVLTNDLYLEYESLIKNTNNPICLKIEKLLDTYNLNKKMLALDLKLYLAYIYVSITKKIFRLKFINNNKTIDLINSLDKNNVIETQLKRKLAIIHATFDHQNSYLVYIDDTLSLPWNDYILPTLARHSFFKNHLLNDLELPYKSHDTKSNMLIREVSLVDYKLELYNLGNAIYNNDIITLNNLLFGENSNNPRLENFLKKTHPYAVSINGTACSYKTTLINNCLSVINKEIDSNACILKIGKLGKFTGKDSNQVLAMSYQYMISSLVQIHYTSLFDRCKFNNMIWRIILTCLDTTDNPVCVALQKFMDFTPYIIKQMKMEPIIIFIDTNVVENRKRMRARDTGSDQMRSLIENYVAAQNIVYGLLAYLCEWPIFPADILLHPKIIKHIVSKIKNSVSLYDGKLPSRCDIPNHKLSITKNNDNDDSFAHAKKLNIFK